jgi:hypothetical protein
MPLLSAAIMPPERAARDATNVASRSDVGRGGSSGSRVDRMAFLSAVEVCAEPYSRLLGTLNFFFRCASAPTAPACERGARNGTPGRPRLGMAHPLPLALTSYLPDKLQSCQG